MEEIASGDIAALRALELMTKLHELRAQRFEWTVEIRDRLLEAWRTHYEAHQIWCKKITDTLSKLAAEGQGTLAKSLASPTPHPDACR